MRSAVVLKRPDPSVSQEGPWLFCVSEPFKGRVHLERDLIFNRRYGVQTQCRASPCTCKVVEVTLEVRPSEVGLIQEYFDSQEAADDP